MKNFGIIKSRIEDKLLESYTKNNFKNEIKNFKKIILENKKFSKLYFLYDDLSTKKGLTESRAKDYINECVTIYENTINKMGEEDYIQLLKWLGNNKSENKYSDIDNLFSQNILTIESRLESKKIICENLQKIETKKSEPINLPLSSMVNVANKTIKTYVESLSEPDKNEFRKIMTEDNSNLENEFNLLKEDILKKLNSLIENSEDTLKVKINETIDKVNSEKFDKLSYFQLKALNENI